jgi:serine/threonine protein kinase
VAKLGPGARIGDQFNLIRKIGEGGCGEVYLAEQTSLGRNAVVKLMHPELSRDPSYVARFRREAQLAARLSHHHVAAIYAFGETPEHVLWIAMEYIEGESLHTALAKDPPREIAEMLAPVADVLDRAGSMGIIHRDVKPDNIIVSPDGGGRRAVLLDFGLARPMEDNDKLTQVGVAVGSPTYMSPEQVFGPSVDAATDRYAFGIILFIAVARRPPFRHDDRVQLVLMHKRQSVPALHTLAPGIPPGHPLDAFFTRALAKKPEDRYPSARQMITEFIACLDQAPLSGDRPASSQAAGPPPVPVSIPSSIPPLSPSGPASIGTKTTGPQPITPGQPPPQPGSGPGSRPTISSPVISGKGLPRAADWGDPLPQRPDPGARRTQAVAAIQVPAGAPAAGPVLPSLLSSLPPGAMPVARAKAPVEAPRPSPVPPAPVVPAERTEETPASAIQEVEEAEEDDESEDEPLPGHRRLLARVGGYGLDIVCATEVLLGKHRDCDVVCRAFPTPEQDHITHGVSRQHARLRVASGKLYLEDLGSLNGTYLDDRRVTGGPVALSDEVRIRLGPVLTLEVRLFKSGAALLRRVDAYAGSGPATLMLWDKVPLGEPLLGLVPATGDSVTRWGVLQNSRPNGDLWWGGPAAVRWRRGNERPSRPQALQPEDRLVLGDIVIEWSPGQKPGLS